MLYCLQVLLFEDQVFWHFAKGTVKTALQRNHKWRKTYQKSFVEPASYPVRRTLKSDLGLIHICLEVVNFKAPPPPFNDLAKKISSK